MVSFRDNDKILLIVPPFFTPWTPPLGITVLKSFLERQNYSVTCLDFNTEPELWGLHHRYFTTLQQAEKISINDGYSKLWPIINAHMLAYVNGASPSMCSMILANVAPIHGVKYDTAVGHILNALVESYFKKVERLVDRVALPSFTTVGTSTYTTSLATSLFVLQRIKQRYPHIATVMGGGVFADDLAPGSDNLRTLLEEYPFVDHVVIGEGELLFLNLLQGNFAKKRVIALSDIGGVTLDLKESLAPDLTDLDLGSYYHLTIEGGRSCPFQCQFCSETIQWGQYRKKPVDIFAEQLVHLAQKYGNRAFFLADSLMNPYIEEFSQELLRRKAQVYYDGYLRVGKAVTDRSTTRLWARSGLYRVRLGVESGSARLLELMNKKTTPELISETLKSLANAGIRTTTYWIVGFPGETSGDFQQTLDFIQAHHSYIYELEAHPYGYHPQGQAGLKLLTGQTLYPEEVNKVIKFKCWDIAGREPTREETYERLRSISRFAAKLGLPNIYTMAERYQAENRWHLLYPLADEIYEGSRIKRTALAPLQQPVPLFARDWKPARELRAPIASSVLCYHLFVKRKLDAPTLSAATEQLIQWNDVLQMSLEQDSDQLLSVVPSQEDQTLLVYRSLLQNGDKVPLTMERLIEQVSAEMSPERGKSLRVVLLAGAGSAACDVLILVHRAIADSQSVIFFLEDLFRIYEQTLAGKEVSLRAVEKGYSQVIQEMTIRGIWPAPRSCERSAGSRLRGTSSLDARNQADRDNRTTRSTPALRRIFSLTKMPADILTDCDLTSAEVLASGIWQSLEKFLGSGAVDLDVTLDSRNADQSWARTVGVLSRTVRLTPRTCGDCAGLAHSFEIRQLLRSLPPACVAGENLNSQPDISPPILLNFEYLVAEPWLGGDEWIPRGFIVDESGPLGAYALEIIPVWLGDNLEVHLKYQAGPDEEEWVKALIQGLPHVLELIQEEMEGYLAAQRFWRNEWGAGAFLTSLHREWDRGHPENEIWATLECAIKKQVLNQLLLECRADLSIALLAAYSILLARLTGEPEITLISNLAGVGLPWRIRLSWDMRFREFVQHLQQQLAEMTQHAKYVWDILPAVLPLKDGRIGRSSFEVGYEVYHSEQEQEARERTEAPALILSVVDDEHDQSVQLSYQPSYWDQSSVGELGAHLAAILAEVSQVPEIPLKEINLGNKERPKQMVEIDTSAGFNF